MSTYGRACANCAKAKTKCLLRQEGERCERCHRLNKICLPSVSTRPQATKSRRWTGQHLATRVAPLEEKLDRLSSLLEGQNKSQPKSLPSDLTESLDSEPSNTLHSHRVSPPEVTSSSGLQRPTSPPTLKPKTQCQSFAGNSLDIFPCPGEPPVLLADQYLATFRTHMLPHFPVVHLDPGITSEQLKDEKPFLWLCRMAVACSSIRQQLSLGDSVREIISREIVFQSKKSLDLLVGILTFIAWSHYQVRYMAFLTGLTQIALSLVYDLGLNQTAQEPRGKNSFRQAAHSRPVCSRPRTPPRGAKTMEERRAVLGCFLLSSTIAQTLKRMDGLRWTPQLDETLSTLKERPECSGDALLAVLVRLRLINAEVNYSHCTWPFGNSVYISKTRNVPNHYLHTLLSQLERVKHDIPTELLDSAILWNEFHCTHLLLNEAFLVEQDMPSYRPDSERIDKFNTSFRTLKLWADSFLKIPLPSYVGFTFLSMCSLAYNLLVLSRFSTLEDQAWGNAKVRESVNILDIADKLVLNYDYIGRNYRLADQHEDMDFFIESARMFRFMRGIWSRELDMCNGPNRQDQEGLVGLEQLSIDPEFTMDWIGTPFLMEILSYPQ